MNLKDLKYQGDFDKDLDEKTRSQVHVTSVKAKETDSLNSIDIDRLGRELPDVRDNSKVKAPKFSKSYNFIEIQNSVHNSRESIKISARVKSDYVDAIKKIPKSENIKQGRGGLGDNIGQLVEDWHFLRNFLKSSWDKIRHYLNRCLDSEKRAFSLKGIGGEKELNALKEYKVARDNLITMAKTLGLFEYIMIDKLRIYGIATDLEYENFIYLTRGNKRDDERLNGEARVWS